jgi:hypothetical protein
MIKHRISDFMAEKPVTTPVEKPVKQGEEIINLTFRLPHSKWKKLKNLSTDERRSIQQILLDALEAEFARRGLPF